ncbi:MAG: hypothetical protein KDD62_06920 [Bdellovibrionales bacterium]|nr:hypothetical protein [Bdellovibrionales bacterium]
MSEIEEKNKRKKIADEVETTIVESYDDFILELMRDMQQGVALPALELRTEAGAREAQQRLSKTLESLQRYQGQVRALKQVLTQRKWELERDDS